MAEYLQTDAYSLPLEHVKLGRMTVAAANATVADVDRVLTAANPKGPCLVTLVAATAVTDTLTIAFPCTQTDEAAVAGITVTLDANTSNALSVTGDNVTGNILIKLASETAASNAHNLIQAAIRALDPSGEGHVATKIKGVSLTGVTCTAGGEWDTVAVAEGEDMTDVAFAGGAGETILAADFEAQPSTPRSVTATAANGTAAGDIGAVSVIVYGTNINDQAISETLPAFTANTAATKESTMAFKTITSVFLPSHDGEGCTISVGTGEKLGLPVMFSKKPLCWATLNGVIESTAPTLTVDADEIEKNTAKLASTLNGTEVCVYLGIPEA